MPPIDARLRDYQKGDEAPVLSLVEKALAPYGLPFLPGSTDADLIDIQAAYLDRGGAFKILEQNHQIIGSCGIYPLEGKTCELRKMYLEPEYKGHGYGKWLLEDALANGVRLGFETMVLESNSVLSEAMELYRRYGFEFHDMELQDRCDYAMWRSLI